MRTESRFQRLSFGTLETQADALLWPGLSLNWPFRAWFGDRQFRLHLRQPELTAIRRSIHDLYMSKNVTLSDDAYSALSKHKRKGESFSDVVKRLAPTPIETFGDLEKYLNGLEGPLFPSIDWIRRVRVRKKSRRARRHKFLD